jgi:hypothetical protein
MRVGQSRRRDAVEPDIVRALRAVGCEVWRVSGPGLPDLLVRRHGVLYAFEVKSGRGRRTEAQESSQFPIIRSVSDALAAVGVLESLARASTKGYR